jgi:hypothetical protein
MAGLCMLISCIAALVGVLSAVSMDIPIFDANVKRDVLVGIILFTPLLYIALLAISERFYERKKAIIYALIVVSVIAVIGILASIRGPI